MKAAVAVCLFLLLAGCTGTLYHGTAALPSPAKQKGVVYYPPMSVVQESETTMLVDSKGIVIGNRTGAGGLKVCEPVPAEKIITVRDYLDPQRIWYDPGVFEKSTLGVTLNADGALLSVNDTSTPDQGNTIKNLAGAAVSAASGIGALGFSPAIQPKAVQAPACNSGAVIIGARPLTIARPPTIGK